MIEDEIVLLVLSLFARFTGATHDVNICSRVVNMHDVVDDLHLLSAAIVAVVCILIVVITT